ncbi:unnamed protein product [Amoebophrya sp. A25]|nr:unnamed protein product [Amoebophrya sp. A25]|eukprot:GSA25T00009671001.1
MVQYARVDLNDAAADVESQGMGLSAPNSAKRVPPKEGSLMFQMCFFGAGVASMFLAVLGILWMIIIPLGPILFPLDFLQEIYLFAAGTVLFVLDAPLNFRWIIEAKVVISKYFRLVTRMTGKGLYLLFMSGLAFSCGYVEDVARWLAVLIALYVAALAVLTLFFGVRRTMKLQQVRSGLQHYLKAHQGDPSSFLQQYSREQVGQLNQAEFLEMSQAVAPSVAWQPTDVRHITAALACEAGPNATLDVVLYADILDWLRPGYAIMM